ncbi:hypothetical protein WDU94_015299 [Cyamophila willieti]
MATIIQRTWRGYYSRRSRFNYKGLQCWLKPIQAENILVERKLQQYNAETAEAYSKSKQEYWDYIRSRLHHLLRTQSIPGVFSCRHSSQLSQIEQCLRNAKYVRKKSPTSKARSTQSLETDEKRRHNHRTSNTKHLRETWQSASNMPTDEFPRCLYDPNWRACKGFSEASNQKDNRLSNDGIDETERSDRLWKERIAMLEKKSPVCIVQEEYIDKTNCPDQTEKENNCYW